MSSAKGGLIVNNEVFNLDAANSNQTTNIAAGVCNYSLTGDSSVVAGSSNNVLNMTLTNNAAAGGPAITAITLTPPPGITITSSGAFSGLNVPANGGTTTLSVTVKSDNPSCVTTPAASWGVSSITPGNFVINPAGSYPKTTITAQSCTLGFDKQPTDAFPGSIITDKPFNSAGNPVTVKLLQGGVAPSATLVTIVSSAACAISGNATTDANGLAKFTTLKSTAAAAVSGCVLTASAPGFNSSNSNAFNIALPAGTLGCDNTNNFASGNVANNPDVVYDPNTDGPFTGTPGWGLRRGLNTTGDCPLVIPYTFTFDGQTAAFVADKLGAEHHRRVRPGYDPERDHRRLAASTSSAICVGTRAQQPAAEQRIHRWTRLQQRRHHRWDGHAIPDNPECPAVLRFGISAVPAKPNRSNVRGAAGLDVVRPRPGSILVEGDRHDGFVKLPTS